MSRGRPWERLVRREGQPRHGAFGRHAVDLVGPAANRAAQKRAADHVLVTITTQASRGEEIALEMRQMRSHHSSRDTEVTLPLLT